MADGEFRKVRIYLNSNSHLKDFGNYPIDVSDIVTLKPIDEYIVNSRSDGFDSVVLGYFSQPVDKEEETQEEPQHILWVEVVKMIENNKAAHLMKYFTIKRR